MPAGARLLHNHSPLETPSLGRTLLFFYLTGQLKINILPNQKIAIAVKKYLLRHSKLGKENRRRRNLP
jgi:hypothetical protein